MGTFALSCSRRGTIKGVGGVNRQMLSQLLGQSSRELFAAYRPSTRIPGQDSIDHPITLNAKFGLIQKTLPTTVIHRPGWFRNDHQNESALAAIGLAC